MDYSNFNKTITLMESDNLKIINLSSYSENLPKYNCKVKVAVKQPNPSNSKYIKTNIFENAVYEDGFVKLNDTNDWLLASFFIFHKLKRKKDKTIK